MKLGDKDWQHPDHRKGIKPQKVFDNMVLGPLTDKKIDRYSRAGVYSNRRFYRRELKKLHMEKALFDQPKRKKLVYNLETQDFEEREF